MMIYHVLSKKTKTYSFAITLYANKDVKLNSTEIWWFTEAELLYTGKSNIAMARLL